MPDLEKAFQRIFGLEGEEDKTEKDAQKKA
jgi:hypothetical protein